MPAVFLNSGADVSTPNRSSPSNSPRKRSSYASNSNPERSSFASKASRSRLRLPLSFGLAASFSARTSLDAS